MPSLPFFFRNTSTLDVILNLSGIVRKNDDTVHKSLTRDCINVLVSGCI